MKVHQIRIDFNVTEQIKRYVLVYLLEGRHCYLIDSGVYGSEGIIEAYLESIGRNTSEIKGVFLTHAHPDHIGTAAYFRDKTGCKIYASKGEKQWIEDINLQYEQRPISNFYNLAGKSTTVDVIVKDGDVLDIDEELSIKVIGTAGHSIDEVSYMFDHVIFVGDSIPVKGDIPIYVDKQLSIDSLEKLRDIENAECYYPAWDRTYLREEAMEKIQMGLDIIQMLEQSTNKVLKKNPKFSLLNIVQLVCEDLNMPQLMMNPLFAKTIQSHF
ncbi:MBL fold metallo-hydrolase [Aminipila sp.]|uniref:MBL fold metallo-hydrolase n=1 Tax=Aminipila sp. TaxID=2060095 RepID=UPI00289BC1E7|nr:MBL fold metallo-hydrolase [Aminipila sp.]